MVFISCYSFVYICCWFVLNGSARVKPVHRAVIGGGGRALMSGGPAGDWFGKEQSRFLITRSPEAAAAPSCPKCEVLSVKCLVLSTKYQMRSAKW